MDGWTWLPRLGRRRPLFLLNLCLGNRGIIHGSLGGTHSTTHREIVEPGRKVTLRRLISRLISLLFMIARVLAWQLPTYLLLLKLRRCRLVKDDIRTSCTSWRILQHVTILYILIRHLWCHEVFDVDQSRRRCWCIALVSGYQGWFATRRLRGSFLQQ